MARCDHRDLVSSYAQAEAKQLHQDISGQLVLREYRGPKLDVISHSYFSLHEATSYYLIY